MVTRIGLDFGTTTTLIAGSVAGGKLDLVPIGRGRQRFMPSDVALVTTSAGDTRILTGEDARAVRSAGENVYPLRSIKRHLGCEGGCASEDEAAGIRCSGDGVILLGGQPKRLVDLVSEVMKEALLRSGLLAGSQGVVAVLGCPTDAGYAERTMLLEAADRAGLTGCFSSKPYASVREEPLLVSKTLPTFGETIAGRYLIVDIGGGSTDIAVVDYQGLGNPINILASMGERFCGGDDIDKQLLEVVLQKLSLAVGLYPEEIRGVASPWEWYQLARGVEEAKQQLSHVPEARINTFDKEVAINRDDLLAAISNARTFEKIGRGIDLAMRRSVMAVGLRHYLNGVPTPGDTWAYKTPEGIMRDSIGKMNRGKLLGEIDYVLFSGGVTAMPAFQEWFAREFPNKPDISTGIPTVIERVAWGAASGVQVSLESIHRYPYKVELRQTASVVSIFKPYEPFRALLCKRPITPDDVAIELESMESDWHAEVPLPGWTHGTMSVQIDGLGHFVAANVETHDRATVPFDEPWRTEPHRLLEGRILEQIAADEAREKERALRGTDPTRDINDNVG